MNLKDYQPTLIKLALNEIKNNFKLSDFWKTIDWNEKIEKEDFFEDINYRQSISLTIAEAFTKYLKIEDYEDFITHEWINFKAGDNRSLLNVLLYCGEFKVVEKIYEKYFQYFQKNFTDMQSSLCNPYMFEGFKELESIFESNKYFNLTSKDYLEFNNLLKNTVKLFNVVVMSNIVQNKESVEKKLKNWNDEIFLKNSFENFIVPLEKIIKYSLNNKTTKVVFDEFIKINPLVLFDKEDILFQSIKKGNNTALDYCIKNKIEIPNKKIYILKILQEINDNMFKYFNEINDSSQKSKSTQTMKILNNQINALNKICQSEAITVPIEHVNLDIIYTKVLTDKQKNILYKLLPLLENDEFKLTNLTLLSQSDIKKTKIEWEYFLNICNEFNKNTNTEFRNLLLTFPIEKKNDAYISEYYPIYFSENVQQSISFDKKNKILDFFKDFVENFIKNKLNINHFLNNKLNDFYLKEKSTIYEMEIPNKTLNKRQKI